MPGTSAPWAAVRPRPTAKLRLREAGATNADLERLYAPAGLDIGAATVEETAIAVLAEITVVRARRSGISLRDSHGSIRREQVSSAALGAPVATAPATS